MIDRLFLATLTFCTLIAGALAIGNELVVSSTNQRVVPVVQLETVVVTGDADALAAVAAALQTVAHQGRVLLGPEATSRRFAKALLERQASLGQDLVTVGLPTDDPMAMTAGEQGQAVTNFLAGVRDASTSQMTSFFDGAPFSEVAWAADAASQIIAATEGGAGQAAFAGVENGAALGELFAQALAYQLGRCHAPAGLRIGFELLAVGIAEPVVHGQAL